MKLHGKNILKCISNNVVSQRRSLKEFGMHCYAFRNVVSQRRSLKEFGMHCYAFRNVVSQRRSLKEFGMHCYAFRNVVSQRRSLKKEFRMYWFISLLNVCFKIFCRKYQTPRGRRRGGMRGRGRRGGRGRGWDF